MRIEQLQEALDRYGGDIMRWPAAERAAAEALAETDMRARTVIAAARRLEGALAEAVTPMAVDTAFIGRIVAGLGAGVHHDVAVRPTRRLVAWASAAMFAFLVSGYAVGVAIPASQGEDAFAGLIFGNSSATGEVATDSGSVL